MPIYHRILLLLVILSCLVTIPFNHLFQDGEWVNAQWLGQDVVTLVVLAPLLGLAQYKVFVKRETVWKYILSGVLFYFAYIYAFYMFAAKLTIFYLFHLPIWGLSLFALFLALHDLFQSARQVKWSGKKWPIMVYLGFISIMLTIIWGSDIVAHLTDPAHTSDTPNGEAPLIIYSLDLALVIPMMILSILGLWRYTQWGIKLTGVILVKAATIGFTLLGMGAAMYFRDQDPEVGLMLLWAFLGIVGSIMVGFYHKNLKITS
jgi:hypothetical protein